MDSIAEISLQLCMHWLDCREIIRFARCSARLRRISACAFVFKHAPLLPIVSSRLPTHPLTSSSPLRHARSSLLWHSVPNSIASVECILTSLPVVYAMDMGSLAPSAWAKLITLQMSKHIRDLRCTPNKLCKVPAPAVEAISSALPSLESICISPNLSSSNCLYSSLSAMSTLTRMEIGLSDFDVFDSALLELSRCSNLRHLHLHAESIGGTNLRRMFDSPLGSALQFLSLDSFSPIGTPFSLAGVTSSDDLHAVFSRLVHLHSFTLIHCDQSNFVLAHIHAFPTLRLLSLTFQANMRAMLIAEDVPSEKALVGVLQQCIELQVRVTAEELSSADRSAIRHSLASSALLHSFGQRFTYEVVGEHA